MKPPPVDPHRFAMHMLRHNVALANLWAGYANKVRNAAAAAPYLAMANEYGAKARYWRDEAIMLEMDLSS